MASHRLCCSVRAGMIVFGFLVTFDCYIMRQTLSLAIVAMTNYTAMDDSDDIHVHECNGTNGIGEKQEDGELLLSKTQHGLILASYYWGYVILQIPGGRLSEIYGARPVLSVSMVVAGILSLLTPVAAKHHWVSLVVVRMMLGLVQGVLFPALQIFFTRWMPPNERSRAIATAFAGTSIGAAAIFPITGVMSAKLGWESVFYLVGTFSILFSILWTLGVTSSPGMHRLVSEKELGYIEAGQKERGEDHTVKTRVPWRQILTSVPVISATVSYAASAFGFYLAMTCFPLFMKEALQFDLQSNGALSALPYISQFIAVFIFSSLVDWILSKQYLSRDVVRKGCTVIAGIGASTAYIGAGYTGCGQEWVAVFLIVIGQTLAGLNSCGVSIAITDMGPQYAGSLMGLVNGAANISGIVVPKIVTAMTKTKKREAWLNVFYLSGGIWVFGSLQFAVFGSAKLQKWAMKESEEPRNSIPMVTVTRVSSTISTDESCSDIRDRFGKYNADNISLTSLDF